MRARIAFQTALALTAFVSAGCKTTPKDRLEGKWVGERVDNFGASQAQRALGWASGMSFEFKGSRVTVSVPAESPRQGTYEITQATEDQMVVTFLRAHGVKDAVTFQLEAPDRLRWMVGDGRSIVLRKVVD
jgi:hypothetical protein